MTIIERLEQKTGLLTVRQVAELLGCHQQTLYGWAAEGKITNHRVGGRVKFDGTEVAQWLGKRQVG